MKDMEFSFSVGLKDKFSAKANKLAESSGKMAAYVQKGAAELSRLGQQKKTIQRFSDLNKKLGATASAMDAAKKKATELGRKLAETEKPSKKLQQQFESSKRSVDSLRDRHKKQVQDLRVLKGELNSAGVDTRKLGEAQRKIAGDFDLASRKMQHMAAVADKLSAARAAYDKKLQLAGSASMLAGGVANVGTQALNIVGAPISSMRTVERSRGELASLGIDKTGIDMIAAKGREMAGQWAGIDTASFVSAAYDIKSGISTLDDAGVAAMTASAAITAKATKAGVGQMTSLFASAYGSFKQSLYSDVSDKQFGSFFSAALAKSVQQFKTDGEKMQQAIQSTGSGLAEAGVSMTDQLTALGMLQQKMEAGVAGTTLNALERTAAKANQKFADMGLDVQVLNESGNLRSLPDLLAAMQAEFGKEYTSEIGSKIQEAFGSDEAVKFFKALWGQQDAFRENAKAVEAATKQGDQFTKTMAAAADANMDARLAKMQQRWGVIKEQIGNALIPVMEKWLPLLEKLGSWASRFISNHTGIAGTLAAIVGGIGLIATVTAPVITAVAALTTAIAGLGYISKKVSAERGLSGGFDSGPDAGGKKGKARGGSKGKLGKAGKGFKNVLGKGGKYIKGGGALTALVGAASIGATMFNDSTSPKEKAAEIATDVGGIGGSLAGAAAGAAIGSVVPIIGTTIGGLLGGIIGGIGGDSLGNWFGGKIRNPDASPAGTTVADANSMFSLDHGEPKTLKEAMAKSERIQNSNVTNMTVSPTINISPGSNAADVKEAVNQSMDESTRRMTQALQDFMVQERRLAYE